MDAPSINVLALPIGYELDGYRIERVLGAGGFGITYLAAELLLGRKVAIKEFLPAGIATRGTDGQTVRPITGENQDMYRWGIDRFRQEAKTLVSFQHPNVVAIERYFEGNGTAYLVMQYIEGRSLGNVLREFETIEAGEILELLLPLLDGLAHVHEAGFLHRDIKPDNIFISTEGRPILIDFGAARQALGQQSKSLTAIVSEGYAPYEQYEARGNQGPWTDIYAVGAVMYRCMTGEKPLAAPSRVAAKFRGRPDPLPAIAAVAKTKYPAAMMAMAEKALAVSEDDRPQTVAELLAMLKDAAPAPAPPPSEAPTGMVPERTLVAADIRPAPKAADEGTLAPAGSARTAPRRRIAPAAIAAGIAALLVAGASAAWIGGAFTPENGDVSTAAMRDAAARDAERRRADEERRRRADEDARRKAEEDARKAEDDRKKAAESEQRRKAEEEARRRTEAERKKAEDEAKRRAEDDRKKAEEAEQRRKADEAAKRQAEDDRKKAEDEAKRRADDERKKADAEREAEQKRRAADERAKAERLKGLIDRAAAQLRAARAYLGQGRLLEARRAIETAREGAAEAVRLEPASAEAKRAAADVDALAGDLTARIAARMKELAAGIERDIAAGRAGDAARKLAEAEKLDPDAAALASLRTDLRALRARQEEALRRRREEEARRRAEAERARQARPPAATPRPAQPAPPSQPPARAPDRRIPIPP